MKTEHRILLVMVLGIPLVAGAVGAGVLWNDERSWQGVLAKSYPEVEAERRAAFSLGRACQDPNIAPQIRGACNERGLQRLMLHGAAGSAALGLGILGAVWAMGRLAAKRRALLLYTFAPGLHITNIVVVILISSNAALAIAAIYFAEAALLGRVHFVVLITIGIGAVLGVVAVVKASLGVVKKAETAVRGRAVSRAECATLWNEIDGVCESLDASAPDHVVLGLEPSFFVTEVPVQTFGERVTGRTIYLSLPLGRILSRDEFRAVLAHEMAHYLGEDTRFSRRFFPIYRGTATALAGLADDTLGYSALALLPAIAVLGFFFEAFSVAESTISRERELIADKVGAAVSGERAMASALVKVHAFSDAWDAVGELVVEAVSEKRKLHANLSERFGEIVAGRAAASAESLKDLDGHRLPHPTDSHPPLGVRLDSLGLTVSAVQDAALAVKPALPAIALVDGFAKLEEEISLIEQRLMADRLGIDLVERPATDSAAA